MSELDADDLGTLVWIGDRAEAEFQDAFQFCLTHVPQVALRSNLDEALRRPAAAVQYVLLARATRQPLNRHWLSRLAALYPNASTLHLLGTLCEGMNLAGELPMSTRRSQGARCYWHRWNQILPEWLGGSEAAQSSPVDHPPSVAVLASTYAAGQPLLELAESAGSTAVWSGVADTRRIRNVDLVWWDDSLAPPTTSRSWRRRIELFNDGRRRPRHAWIANAPRFHQQREAAAGGIEVVVSKPNRIECLLAMLDHQIQRRVARESAKAA